MTAFAPIAAAITRIAGEDGVHKSSVRIVIEDNCIAKEDAAATRLCLANCYSRGDWRVEKTVAMLLPCVGIKRSAGGTSFTRLLLWGVPI